MVRTVRYRSSTRASRSSGVKVVCTAFPASASAANAIRSGTIASTPGIAEVEEPRRDAGAGSGSSRSEAPPAKRSSSAPASGQSNSMVPLPTLKLSSLFRIERSSNRRFHRSSRPVGRSASPPPIARRSASSARSPSEYAGPASTTGPSTATEGPASDSGRMRRMRARWISSATSKPCGASTRTDDPPWIVASRNVTGA